MSRDTNWMCGGCGYITTDPESHDCSIDDEELSKEDERYASLSNDLGHAMRDVKLLKKYNDSHCVRLDSIKSQMIILEQNISRIGKTPIATPEDINTLSRRVLTLELQIENLEKASVTKVTAEHISSDYGVPCKDERHESDALKYYGRVCL